MIRFRGEGQVFRATNPAVARPQSRRLSHPLRLFEHFLLTRAFVEAVDPHTEWFLVVALAVTVTTDRGCWWEREVVAQQRTLLLAAGWQLMISISYLLVQKVIRLLWWSTRPYRFCIVIDQLKHRNRRLSWNVAISNCASHFETQTN